MADCKEIDASLVRLGGKIDRFNGSLNNLDNRLKNLEKEKTSQDTKGKNEADLSAIYKRLDELEDAVRKIVRYVETIDNAIASANNSLKFITNLFNL